MRLGVYTDFPYGRRHGVVHAEQAFSLFVAGLASRFERLLLIGRLDPGSELARYPLPPEVGFLGLPHYPDLARAKAVARAALGSLRRFWRGLESLDAVWLLGPHPLSIAFALLARARGRDVFFGVRQDLPAYTRRRHPGRPAVQLAASVLEGIFRILARRCPTVVVGPALRRRYANAAALHETSVSLVHDSDLVDRATALSRSYDGELTVLSVGRLAAEKNPLMLADVLAKLCADEPGRWRLVVCGEGPLAAALARRLAALGVADRALMRGYVPAGTELLDAYRSSHFLLLTSWTEGLPQVVVEALAAGLPVVATDVGGTREAVGEAVAPVAPGDPAAAARELRRLRADPEARNRQVEAGLAYASTHTLERELDGVARFLIGSMGSSTAEAHVRLGDRLRSGGLEPEHE